MRVALCILLLGCYDHHVVDPTHDAAIDTRPSIDAGCAASDRFINATIEGDVGCASPFGFFNPVPLVVADDDFVFEATRFDTMCETRCQVAVRGVSLEVADGFAQRLERIADGYAVVESNRLVVRDTSLCDGPPAEECPLAFQAESGGLRLMPGFGEVGVSWGDAICDGECGQVRNLVFELSFGERIELAIVPQGGVSRDSSAMFANLRSWNSCTDEPDIVTWAYWTF